MHNAIIKTIETLAGSVEERLFFICPGCRAAGDSGYLMLPFNTDGKLNGWWWNGDLDVVTISPSILTRGGRLGNENGICHSFLINGVFEYLPDSTHPLAGQKVPMVELEYGKDPV